MKVRIGIDVGGTFTDAVAIDNETYELIGTLKVPTTHSAEEGVARGIVEVLLGIIRKYNINPEDVLFIAHGTTQATNALLEGDVVPVGIITVGTGLEGLKSRGDTNIGDIELAPGKILKTFNRYIDTKDLSEESIVENVEELRGEGCGAIVAAQAFSVDDPSIEKLIMEVADDMGIPATATHEITKLYGLKIRTRTAAINACILPKMMETANMTEESVKKAGIKAPLMIMRCDGGVMDINEVRKRPILTLLSGPAAGVAGALMYERVSDGIFLEVGGTSTDISVIKNGRVMVEYAEIGGNKTYLNSLDVRTVGIAGGSMVRIGNNDIEDVGPRSAHIAGLPYAVFANPDDIIDPELKFIQPMPGDPSDYIAIKSKNGKMFALTTTCAANVLGYVKPGDYAFGNREAAIKAMEPVAKKLNMTVEDVAKRIMNKACEKDRKVVEQLIQDYNLDKDNTTLIGGGGGSTSIVPYLAEVMGMSWKIAKNAEVISTIGVAMAMVREVVERTIPNPTDKDIIKIRKEAKEVIMRAGALEDTIEVFVEIDAQKNILRAIATGATELRSKDMGSRILKKDELIEIAAQSMKIDKANIKILDSTEFFYVAQGVIKQRGFLGLFSKELKLVRIIDAEGVIRLQRNSGIIYSTVKAQFDNELNRALDENIFFGDGGAEIPDCYLILPHRMVDLSGLIDKNQIVTLANAEVNGLAENEKIIILISKRGN
ncbi:hydantoinase/oxoprolinase family protein [Calorimonas adulescens]|uniref:Hydantoinase/oxoprolinase family protein n=1 Tax=Calorimonas adulescens TaxID=2606906 RepID=A0A5D8QAP2_9THEO|nr:hydantoinase/oxoprolinase family protein [Calorimonas adulescens]TZE81457.1 hydantoinase/oxoprolinase family protein [Calorimonas adulescens]